MSFPGRLRPSVAFVDVTRENLVLEVITLSLHNMETRTNGQREASIMAVEKIEKDNFVYVTYDRQGFKDVEHFKASLSNLANDKAATKDIIVDFRTAKYLTSPEIGALVRLANQLHGTQRIVRVIPSDELFKQFSSVNLTAVDRLTIYKNRQDFSDHLKGDAS